MTETSGAWPRVSVIVPVFGAERTVNAAIRAILASDYPDFELIVTNDGSRDASGEILERAGVRVLDTEHGGPASARNVAVAASSGPILFFTDADVIVARDTIRRGVEALVADPGLAAVFGSYAREAGASGFFSAYKNYVHHFTHQQASRDAFTFWTGCGFVRRSVFERLGGFDEGQRYLSDVELGYRMHLAGLRVRLDGAIQVVHHKHYDLAGLLRSDFFGRAIPWTRLMMRHRTIKRDLNLRLHNVLSVPLAFLALAALAAAPWLERPALALGLVALVALVLLNASFLRFVQRAAGIGFAARTALVQWLIYLLSGIGVLAALAGAKSGGR